MGLMKRLSKLFSAKKREVCIVCVGLDNSGKSTIMQQLKPKRERKDDMAPTVGYSVESFRYSNVFFTSFDMSGQNRYREIWGNYYEKCDAIVFVVDSSDRLRIAVAKEELDALLNHRSIVSRPNLPILFYANKRDVRESMTAAKCAQLLGLDKGNWASTDNDFDSNCRPWYILPSNAKSGEGLEEGMKWICQKIKGQKGS